LRSVTTVSILLILDDQFGCISSDYFLNTLASIQSQTFSDFELFILDNRQLVLPLHGLKKIVKKDKRIKCLDNFQIGLINFYDFLKSARGEFIALINSGCIATPDRIEKQYLYFKENPDLAVLGGSVRSFDYDEKEIKFYVNNTYHELIVSNIEKKFMFNISTIMIRKEMAFKYNFLNISEKYFREFCLSVSQNYLVANIPDILSLEYKKQKKPTVCEYMQWILLKNKSSLDHVKLAHSENERFMLTNELILCDIFTEALSNLCCRYQLSYVWIRFAFIIKTKLTNDHYLKILHSLFKMVKKDIWTAPGFLFLTLLIFITKPQSILSFYRILITHICNKLKNE
jgi:hypothetical protein